MSPAGGAAVSGVAGCPACGERAEPEDRFCEGCGAALPSGPDEPSRPAVPAPACPPHAAPVTGRVAPLGGGLTTPGPEEVAAHAPAPVACSHCDGTVADDGFCDECGRPGSREHAEYRVPGAAAVTDLGLVRAANEDAFGLVRLTPYGADDTGAGDAPDDGADDVIVAVVCDGVASVPGSAEASAVACRSVVEVARDCLHPGPAEPIDLVELTHACCDAAIDTVTALARPGGDAPACTYVSAVVQNDVLVVGWIGDSRAYWLRPDDPGASSVLTADDSWAAEAVAVGLLDAASAWADPRAHAITRWVAADGPGGGARTAAHVVDHPGVLLICSDGLWNHVPDPDDLARLVRDDPAATADAMLEAALDAGGTDNTTLVVLDLPVAPRNPT